MTILDQKAVWGPMASCAHIKGFVFVDGQDHPLEDHPSAEDKWDFYEHVNVILDHLKELLVNNRAWITNGHGSQQSAPRQAPPPSAAHHLQTVFKQAVYDINRAQIAETWPRLGFQNTFFPGTDVFMFNKLYMGQYRYRHCEDQASLLHHSFVVSEGSGNSWWVSKNGHACPCAAYLRRLSFLVSVS